MCERRRGSPGTIQRVRVTLEPPVPPLPLIPLLSRPPGNSTTCGDTEAHSGFMKTFQKCLLCHSPLSPFAAGIHPSVPGCPAGPHGRCDAAAEAWRLPQRAQHGEYVNIGAPHSQPCCHTAPESALRCATLASPALQLTPCLPSFTHPLARWPSHAPRMPIPAPRSCYQPLCCFRAVHPAPRGPVGRARGWVLTLPLSPYAVRHHAPGHREAARLHFRHRRAKTSHRRNRCPGESLPRCLQVWGVCVCVSATAVWTLLPPCVVQSGHRCLEARAALAWCQWSGLNPGLLGL